MDGNRFDNTLSVILDGLCDDEISNFDVRNGIEFFAKFTSEATGDMSPVIRLAQLQNLPGSPDQLVLDNAQQVNTFEQLSNADQSVFAILDGTFVLAIKATHTTPNMWAGTPDGLGLFRRRCAP